MKEHVGTGATETSSVFETATEVDEYQTSYTDPEPQADTVG
jgi:hypothetical protein